MKLAFVLFSKKSSNKALISLWTIFLQKSVNAPDIEINDHSPPPTPPPQLERTPMHSLNEEIHNLKGTFRSISLIKLLSLICLQGMASLTRFQAYNPNVHACMALTYISECTFYRSALVISLVEAI